MTIFNELDVNRSSIGTFSEKGQGFPEINLAYPELPAYDPTFFYDRTGTSAELAMVHATDLPKVQQDAIRNATQAVNDSWVIDNGVTGAHVGGPTTWVETVVYQDGDLTIADIQHKDQAVAPYGALIAFDKSGKIVGQFDNVADNFGERWVPVSGLRAQLLGDLAESSVAGDLGDQL